MKLYLFAVSIWTSVTCLSQESPTKNVNQTQIEIPSFLPNTRLLLNTLFYSVNGKSGTLFLATYKGKAYAVTARHILPSNITDGTSIKIKIETGSGIINTEVTSYFHQDPQVDVAILVIPGIPLPAERIPISDSIPLIFVGQNLMFLGYPLGIATIVEDNRAVPLVKRAILSGMFKNKTTRKTGIYLLDGHNNSGFSGGPVVATETNSEAAFVTAVISGFINDPQYIEQNSDGKKSTLQYQANSGIILAVPIEYAVDIIRTKIQK